MEIIKVNPDIYKQKINSCHRFNIPDFNDLNNGNADEVYYFLFKDTKIRLGLIAGVRDKTLFSPFSAPYGGFDFLKKDVKLQAIEKALQLLQEWAKENQVNSIKFILPPDFFHTTFIAKQINCLYRAMYKIQEADLNYSYDLKNFDKNYASGIWRNARKNLNKAIKNDLSFVRCELQEEKQKAYEIIKENRKVRGFPMRMEWKQIENTVKIIPADFFLLKDKTGNDIASAIIYYVTDSIIRVIYWGDLPEFAYLKTMNFLSFKVFEYYKNKGVQHIDIGISTENSIPNYGLCEFKESIGCDITTNFTFVKNLHD